MIKRATKTTHTTRFETLLQNEFKSDVARYTTHVQTGLSTNQVVSGCKKLLQKVEGSFTLCNNISTRCTFYRPSWGPFLESPVNFSGPKSNIQIEIKRIRARVPASKLLHFVLLTDSFIMLDAKLLKPRSLMATETAYGHVIYRDFRETGPRANK